jgi:hypothetical protein
LETPHFSFVSADFKNSDGRKIRLERVQAEFDEKARKPLRLRMIGQPPQSLQWWVEMSRREAYAFSEWLDAVVTQTVRKRRPKIDQENGQ